MPATATGPLLHPLKRDTPARRGDAARQIDASCNDVSDILKELSYMDERLQSFFKRQRLAIHESGLVDDVPPRRPLKPQSARRTRRDVTRQHMAEDVPMAARSNEIEHAPVSDADAIASVDDSKADEMEHEAEEDPAERGATRPPPACLNTYLRESNPPVFSSRTYRIASIIQHRYPLADPSQPEHQNNDVFWTVHDLLPICEQLNIPIVLDFHHYNILFNASELREGTADISELFPRIRATWTRKEITQKMHYSEPCPGAVTPRDRRKHSPRVRTLPPCVNDMDLMVEAKDKEQAVFDLIRAFRLPGYDTFNDIVPHVREDDYRLLPKPKNRGKKKTSKKKKRIKGEDEDVDMDQRAGSEANSQNKVRELVSAEGFGMGGPQNRVYWPEGMKAWLRPKKWEVRRRPS
ncbi:hypothetical protein ACHAQH_007724 [Verticillium albo-atrum]